MTRALNGVNDGQMLNDTEDNQRMAILASADRWNAVYAGTTAAMGAVAFQFSDGPAIDYSTVYPLLRDRNLVAGFAPILANVGTGGNVTLANLKEMESRGMEIMGHTRTHGSNPAGLNAFIDEVQTAADDLQSQANVYVQSFTQPGTWTDTLYCDTTAKMDATIYGQIIRSRYAGYTAYINPTPGTSYFHPLPTHRRYGGGVPTSTALTLSQLETKLTPLLTTRGGYVMGFESVNLNQGGYISTADFTTFLDWVKTQRDAGLLDVLTPSGLLNAQVAPTHPSIIMDGNFADSTVGNLVHWAAVGSPTVVAAGGYNSANCVSVTNTNYITQSFYAGSLRSIWIEAWVKAATGGQTPTFQMEVVDAADAGNLDAYANIVTSDSWQKISFCAGIHPNVYNIIVKLHRSGAASSNILVSNVKAYKL